MSPPPPVEPSNDSENAELFDYKAIKDYTLFVLGAPRRRPALAVALLLFVLGGALLALMLFPKTYRVQTVILAQPNLVLPVLGNPRRAIPGAADAPTRAASETVHQYDNLVSLVRQTDLVAGWQATRSPLHQVKDWIMLKLRGPATEEDMREALVGLLEKRLKVEAAGGVVTIAIDWPDAQLAYLIVKTAQQNFLERRHALDVAAIEEAISILQDRSAQLDDEVEDALEQARQARLEAENEKYGSAAAAAAAPRPAPKTSAPPDRALNQLRGSIASKRRAMADLEAVRQRNLSDLEAELRKQRTMYGPAHPVVLNTQDAIAAQSQPSPQMQELRREEQGLMEEFLSKGGRDVEAAPRTRGASAAAAGAQRVSAQGLHIELAPIAPENEKVNYATARLQMVVAKQEELANRLEGAQIELETSRAAFKFRYTEIKPPQVPKKPIAPNPKLIMIGGVLGALFAMFFGTAGLDVWTGRILARWQIERTLRVPVLAELTER